MNQERRSHSNSIEAFLASPPVPFDLFVNWEKIPNERKARIINDTSMVLGIEVQGIINEIKKHLPNLSNNNLEIAVKSGEAVLKAISQIAPNPELVDSQEIRLKNEPERLLAASVRRIITQASLQAAFYLWFDRKGGRQLLEKAVVNPIARIDYNLVDLQGKVLHEIDDQIDWVITLLCQSNPRAYAQAVANLNELYKDFAWEVVLPKPEAHPKKPSLNPLARLAAVLTVATTMTASNPEPTSIKPPTAITTDTTSPRADESQESAKDPKENEPIPVPPQITIINQEGNKVPAPEVSIDTNEIFHVIEKGDSLSQIAKKYWNNGEISMQDLIRFTRALFMINPHLGKDINKIEVGQRVFVYPDQMKGKFAKVLVFLLEGKGKLEDLEGLIKELAIPTVDSQNEFVSLSKKGKWVIYENKELLPLEVILKKCFGAFGEKTLSLINRINHMKMDEQGVVPVLVLPPEGWLGFQIENNLLPPAIVIPQISVSSQTPIEQPEVNKISRPTPALTRETPTSTSLTHVVVKGENLLAIAKRYRTTVDKIVAANNIANPNKIFVGQKLRIPGRTETSSPPVAAAETGYTVQQGDTLSAIARRYNTTVTAIIQANGIADPNLIRVGQRLKISGKDVSVKGVYQELPKGLEKYLGGYWATWDEIPEELRLWLAGIITEETSVQRVPVWAVLSIMSAEQIGGFRLTSRSGAASDQEPFGITPGWELTYFGTNQKRFGFREQVMMVSKRLVANSLSVDTLSKEGETAYREKLEIYLCKHNAGEGRACGPDSPDRRIKASPSVTVQNYVDAGSQTAKVLVESPTLPEDIKGVIANKVARETEKELGVTPPKEEVEASIGKNDPKAVVNGEKPLDKAVNEAVEKQVETARENLEKEVKKIVQPPEPTKPEAEKPKIIVPPKEELSRIQTSAQKSLCRPVSAEEIVVALKTNGNDPNRAIEYLVSSPEAAICLQAKESWKKATGKEALTSQARVVAEEAMKVWGGQDPRTLSYPQIEAAKKRVEEILEVQKKENPQESKVFDTEKKVRLPQVSRPYQSGNLKLRDTVAASSGELNNYEVHGNKDYKGVPSWLGQDFQTDSPDKTVVSPIDGVAESGWDPNAGYYISIRGTGIYEGLHVRIIHLAGETTIGGQINRGQNIGQEGPQAHLHIITLWGDGGFNASAKDVPFSLLLPEDQKPKSKYQAGNYIELYSLGNEYFNWFELK